MVQTALDSLRFDPGLFKGVEHLLCDLLAANMRVLLLVVVAREAIETREGISSVLYSLQS